jgi:folate-binding protein YgfZ
MNNSALAVLHFGDPLFEYNSIKEKAALMNLSGSGLFVFTGADHVDYLHRQFTRAFNSTMAGDCLEATFLKGDGRLISVVTAARLDNEALVVVPEAGKEIFAENIGRFIIADDVEVSDISEISSSFGLVGPQAASTLAEVFNLPGAPEPGRFTTAQWSDRDLLILNSSKGTLNFFILIVPGDISGEVWKACLDKGVSACGRLAWDALRVEQGIPDMGQDLPGRIIPLGAGLDELVSFDKGCFPGQEVVARIHNLGHPKEKLVRLKLDSPALPESQAGLLFNGKKKGRLTTISVHPESGEKSALGFVNWDLREPGTDLEIESGGMATVLPFSD